MLDMRQRDCTASEVVLMTPKQLVKAIDFRLLQADFVAACMRLGAIKSEIMNMVVKNVKDPAELARHYDILTDYITECITENEI
jgi:hypothetical protein